MIRKTKSQVPGCVRVVFELPSCIWADRIFLCGDFNDWDESSLPLRQERDGVWRIALDLPAGHRYDFRYIVDGTWQTDYHADGFSTNAHNSENSVVDTEFNQPELPVRGPGSQLHERDVTPTSRDAARRLVLPLTDSPTMYPTSHNLGTAA